jgi:WD40 repeat protein
VAGKSGVSLWPVREFQGGATISIGPPEFLAGESVERRAAMTADGRLLAATDKSRNIVELFEIASLKRTWELSGLARIAAAAPSPDGRWCIGSSWPESDLALWRLDSGELVRKLDLDGPPKFAFHPSGNALVVNGRNQGLVYSLPELEIQAHLPQHSAGGFGIPCYSPDGRILAMTRHGYLIQLLDATTYDELATLEPTQPMLTGHLTFSPDGTRLAAVSGANAIILWDLRPLRENLAAMNLDWPQPSYSPAQPLPERCPQVVIKNTITSRPTREASAKPN